MTTVCTRLIDGKPCGQKLTSKTCFRAPGDIRLALRLIAETTGEVGVKSLALAALDVVGGA